MANPCHWWIHIHTLALQVCFFAYNLFLVCFVTCWQNNTSSISAKASGILNFVRTQCLWMFCGGESNCLHHLRHIVTFFIIAPYKYSYLLTFTYLLTYLLSKTSSGILISSMGPTSYYLDDLH